jgi:hypothetical protein
MNSAAAAAAVCANSCNSYNAATYAAVSGLAMVIARLSIVLGYCVRCVVQQWQGLLSMLTELHMLNRGQTATAVRGCRCVCTGAAVLP